jgi:tetratricopeptide (TPR) repeat protein
MEAIIRLVAILLLAGGAASGGQKWIRIESKHFEVISDSGAGPARQVLERFEVARRVFLDAPGAPAVMPPVRVFVFRSERNYEPFRLGPTVQAFFQSGPERDWVVIRYAGAETDRIAVHEYVHALLNRSQVKLPRWLEEGTAELYSTVAIAGRKIIVGIQIPTHIQVLHQAQWLDAAQLFEATKESPYYNEASKSGIFYAQSWALAHMLNLGAGYRSAMPSFVQNLADGIPAASAFRAAFGKSLDDAIADLRGYVATGMRPAGLGAPPGDDPEPANTPESFGEAEALAERAELLLLMQRNDQALALYRELSRRFPDAPDTAIGLAILALRERRFDDARDLFRKAIDRGSRDASAYFEYAMLLRETGAPRDEVDAMLRRTVEVSPDHAEAHFILGVRAGESGNTGESIAHLEKAVEIQPRQALLWQELAEEYLKANRTAEAQVAVRRALQLSTTPQDEGRARTLLESME